MGVRIIILYKNIYLTLVVWPEYLYFKNEYYLYFYNQFYIEYMYAYQYTKQILHLILLKIKYNLFMFMF